MAKTFTDGYNEDQAQDTPIGDNLTGDEVLGFDPSTGTKSFGMKLSQIKTWFTSFFSDKSYEATTDALEATTNDHVGTTSIHYGDAPADGRGYVRANNSWYPIDDAPGAAILNPPINVTADANGSYSSITVAWDPPTDIADATAYNIYWFDNPTFTLVGTVDVFTNSYLVNGLIGDTEYTYVVRSAAGALESINSPPATATTGTQEAGTGLLLANPFTGVGYRFATPGAAYTPIPLVAPVLDAVNAASDTALNVSFTDQNNPTADNWKIYANLSNPQTVFTQDAQYTGLQPDTEYSITVTAVRNG